MEPSLSLSISISIVSHRHGNHVAQLIEDLTRLGRKDIEVVLTLNLPESLCFDPDRLPFPCKIIANEAPKGFAANHNAAFALSQGRNFVILNPDIRIPSDPFDVLLSFLETAPNSICAPLIVNDNGEVEDSARCFPTPFFLLRKLLSKTLRFPAPHCEVPINGDVLMPDWVAGMFIVVPRRIYAQLNGLDERYFLYYEDVDFCARARMAGFQVLVTKKVQVTHNAQRDSHRKFRYLVWHLKSACRFFFSPAFIRIRVTRMFSA